MNVEIHAGKTGDPEDPKFYDLVVTHPNGFSISETYRCIFKAEARAREAAAMSSGTVKIVYTD